MDLVEPLNTTDCGQIAINFTLNGNGIWVYREYNEINQRPLPESLFEFSTTAGILTVKSQSFNRGEFVTSFSIAYNVYLTEWPNVNITNTQELIFVTIEDPC